MKEPDVCVWGGSLGLIAFSFGGTHVLPMDVPRLGVTLDLHEQASAIARAMWDPSCIWDVEHSSGQPGSLVLLKEAGMVCILTDPRGGYVC